MANKKTGMYCIDANIKFEDLKSAKVFQKRLRDKIAYDIKCNGIKAQAMIVISNERRDCSQVRFEHTGKRGRPKKVLIEYGDVIMKCRQGVSHTDLHLHILIISCPIDYGKKVKEYMDKNWCNNVSNIVYKKSCNIHISDYYIDQSICDSAFCSSSDFNYTLKQYHNEFIMQQDKYEALIRKSHINNWNDTKLRNELDKMTSPITDMINYFDTFSIPYDTKRKEDWKNKKNKKKKSKKGNKLPNRTLKKQPQTLLISTKNEHSLLPYNT